MPDEGGTDDTDEDADDGDAGESPRGPRHLSVDAILGLLAQQERRDLIQRLQQESKNSCSFEKIVEHLLSKTADRTGERPGHDNMEVQLQHVHLPKLADAGLIEYDVRSQTVRYNSHDEVEQLLERIHEFERNRDGTG